MGLKPGKIGDVLKMKNLPRNRPKNSVWSQKFSPRVTLTDAQQNLDVTKDSEAILRSLPLKLCRHLLGFDTEPHLCWVSVLKRKSPEEAKSTSPTKSFNGQVLAKKLNGLLNFVISWLCLSHQKLGVNDEENPLIKSPCTGKV